MRIDNLLFKLYSASLAAYDEEKCLYPQWGFDNLEWYISTSRASLDFIAACESLSKRRMITLIRKASVGNAEESIAIAKRYLKII